jgi:hypothetical protein
MTTSCEIGAVEQFGRLATREAGKCARHYILETLKSDSCDFVSIDMTGMTVTPSFADECFGVLIAEIGYDSYNHKITLQNIPPAAEALILHVLNRRTGKSLQFTNRGSVIPIASRDQFMSDLNKVARKARDEHSKD